MTQALFLRVGIAASTLPFLILLIQYVFRTRWWESSAGRALAGIIMVGTSNSIFALMSSLWPKNAVITDIRIGARYTVTVALWYLVYVIQKARKEAASEARIFESREKHR